MKSRKNIPQDWPTDLQLLFSTPIAFPEGATETGQLFHRMAEELRKVDLLADHYRVGSGPVYMLTLVFLCRELFPGFHVENANRARETRNRRILNEAILVHRVEAIEARDAVGIDRALRTLKKEHPEHRAAAQSLRTRYFEARKKPDVRRLADGFTKMAMASENSAQLLAPILKMLLV